MKAEAILKLYNTVVKVIDDENGMKAYDINENEITITNWDEVETKATELQAEYDAKIQANIDLKASAKAKLIAGEPLTKEEAETIVL